MPALPRHTLAVACCLALASVGRAAEDRPVVVAASPRAGGHVHPSVCRTPDGTLVVVYKGQNVLMRTRSTDGGKTWETPEPIPTTARRPASVREVKTFEVYPGTADALPDGRVLVTWNYIADDKATDGYYERALLYTVSAHGGKTWSDQRVTAYVYIVRHVSSTYCTPLERSRRLAAFLCPLGVTSICRRYAAGD